MPPLVSSETAFPAESAVGRFCARLAEAGWLMAVALIPLLYDPHADNGFDSAKSATLRLFGIILLGATLVRGVGGLARDRDLGRFPRIFPPPVWLLGSLGIVLSAILATAISVNPWQSFWGSPQWLQGTFTLCCQVGFFIGVAVNLRSGEQIDRLVNTALAASIPLSIYAMIQHAGMDPQNFTGDRTAAISFAGHPIFMAGYLLMLMPLSVWRLWGSLRPDAGSGRPARTLFFALVLLLQFAAFLCAEKRGPLVALLLASTLGVLLLAACRRHFRWVGWGLGLAATGGVFLLLLAALGRADLLPRGIPILGRLALIVPLDALTGDVFRASLWAKGPDVVLAAKPFLFPDGTPDSWHALRPFLGFGPETLQSVLPHYWMWVSGGPTLLSESRFHNMFWETWQSVGLLGLAAWWSFYAIIFCTGSRALGLTIQKGDGVRMGLLAAASGALGGVLLADLYGWGYVGLGFQIGFACGLVLAAVANAFTHRHGPLAVGVDDSSRWLIVALLVSLLGHQIDMGFAFPTGNTSLLFWLFAGVIVGRTTGLRSKNSLLGAGESATDSPRESRPWVRAGLITGALSGVILATMLHGFVTLLSFDHFTAGDVLGISLTRIRATGALSYLVPLLFLPTWIAANFGILHAFRAISTPADIRKSLALAGAVSALLTAAFAILQAQWVASVGPIPAADIPLAFVLSQAAGLGALGLIFLGLALVAMLVLAEMLPPQSGDEPAPTTLPEYATAALVLALAVFLFGPAVGRVVRNEAFGKWALILDVHDRKQLAAGVYEQALRIQPRDIPNRIMCGLAWMASAEAETKPEAYSEKMDRAAAMLLSVRQISELNVANYHLGRLLLRRGLRFSDASSRSSAGQHARDALMRATNYAPETETAWVEASLVDHFLLGDERSASENLRRANALTKDVDSTPWGDFYAQQAFANDRSALGAFYAARAERYFKIALYGPAKTPQPKNPTAWELDSKRYNTFRSLVTLGRVEKFRGRNEAALASLLEAARTGDDADVWEAEALLARLYSETGKADAARAHLEIARAKAPKEARQELASLDAQILKKTSP